MADKTFDWLNPFASVDLGIGKHADGIKQWAISNRETDPADEALFRIA
jgi:glycine betaine/proline transport system permease protein